MDSWGAMLNYFRETQEARIGTPGAKLGASSRTEAIALAHSKGMR